MFDLKKKLLFVFVIQTFGLSFVFYCIFKLSSLF